MENSPIDKKELQNKKKTDNLILTLFAYYIASVPIALVIAGLLYPYLENISYVIFLILAIIFLVLTFRVQKFDNNARIILTSITILLLVGSTIFPFVIPNQNNPILSHMDLYYHSLNFADYLFYLLAVDGTFLIFGTYMIYVLLYEKRTVALFKKV